MKTNRSKSTARASASGVKGVRFKKTILPNGVRVLTEAHPLSRAVSCGIMVTGGTRDERPDEGGLAHFVEHLVFKRTKKRTAYEVARDMEAVGGDLNAYTSRESTIYVTHALKDELALSIDVLADLVCNPLFDAGDIRKEKQVVIQEIRMAEDQLEDCIFDHYFERVYRDSSIGRPILGTIESISGMKREKIVDFHRRLYIPENLIVSVAGNVEHDEVVDLVYKYLKLKNGRSSAKANDGTPAIHAFRDVIKRPSEQAHILVGLPSADFRSRYKVESYIVNALLGGGMTSRLYQTVREERGLVYSIYSQLMTGRDTGLNLVYASAEPKKAPDVLELVLKEMRRIKKDGLKKSELEFFKRQVRGQIVLGADDIESRMNALAVNEMVLGRYRSVDDIIRDVENVSWDSVHEYLEETFDLDKLGILLMGALPEAPTRKWLDTL